MNRILIICGSTATGKTQFALTLAQKYSGELVSADSRQVYVGKDIITGKDLPSGQKPHTSHLKWRDRYLPYYLANGIRIWLYDIVYPHQTFGVGPWKECVDLVINDVHSRHRLPIVVGGTGLFLKSLTQSLSHIAIPPNLSLREKFKNKGSKFLFNYLNKIDPHKSASFNKSDRANPRRLLRAIEIAHTKPQTSPLPSPSYNYLSIGLTAPREHLYRLVDQRVHSRIAAGAAREDPHLAADPQSWQNLEHAIVRRQLTWFKKQSGIIWFDITRLDWQISAQQLIESWYNESTPVNSQPASTHAT